MVLSQIYESLGTERFADLLRTISMGKLKTYQLYERLKIRLHVQKLNSETLKKISYRLYERIQQGDQDLATELAQAILLCNMDVVVDVLDHNGIPHEDGFFAKELDPKEHLKDNWRENTFQALREKYSPALLVFYLNHLAFELSAGEDVFTPDLATA